MESVGDRVLANTDLLLARLDALPGVRLLSRTEPARRSGIVSFASDTVAAPELHRRLAQASVACAHRGKGIRLSPHFYQGEEEMEQFAKVLEEALL
jgi:selenocysteine lyase/cysteine desulfurase